MKTKKDIDYSFEHTKQRLAERYGLWLTRPEYVQLCTSVQNYKGQYESTAGDVQKVVAVPFRGVLVTCVYSWNRSCITTVLKPNRIGTSFQI